MAIRVVRLIGRATVLVLLLGGFLAPRTASAQQWHELYSSGVAALRGGEAEKAVELLRRTIEKRPRPGVRVPTYGTNFEPQYYPYLRLAEAYLLLGAAEDAAAVLQTSAQLGVEPEEERAVLQARAGALLEAKRPPTEPAPAPTPTPTPTPTPPPDVPAGPTEDAAPAPEPTTVAPPPAAAPAPAAAPPTAPRPPATLPPSAERPRPGAPARARPPEPPVSSGLDIVSDPPGAQVFLDDEPVGRTDPETGRLRLRELAPGRHRLRLSSEGRGDLIREIDLARESVAVEEVVLPRRPIAPSPATPSPAPPARATLPVGPVVGVGVLAALVIGLWLWRQAGPPTGRVASGDTRRSGEGRRDSGSDEVFPAPFGDYSLVRRIGKGGMAVVYEATRKGESFAL
ncbi:MAG: PEGA domain-containing protein, partial [Acidobacteria bacterium]|nr:PEGA domain-containing protein [Acidobacteriota bacterium]